MQQYVVLGIKSLTLARLCSFACQTFANSCCECCEEPISGAASSDKDDKDNLKDLPAYVEYVQGEFSDVDVANRISMFDKELCVTDSDGDHAAEFYEVDGDLLVRTLPVENQVIMI